MLQAYNTDSQTLFLLKQGDTNAFEVIFQKYYTKIYHFVLNTLYDKTQAEDITQNVFLAIWEHRENISPERSFSSYLYTIAKNLVFRETEKMVLFSRYEDYVVQTGPIEADFSTLEAIDCEMLKETIFKLIDQLPEARKKIFLLHFKEELSNKEIAERLSISVENVETQVGRSLAHIRKHLKISYSLLMMLLYIQ